MSRPSYLGLISALALVWLAAGPVYGQGRSGLQAAMGVENVLVDVIARAEKSVVAIARVAKERPGEAFNVEIRPHPFGLRPVPTAGMNPTDPDFVPDEFATGVVIDRQGLILTAYHVLGEDSDYYVTTSDRKVYRARIKGADPRSDLAVLAVEATDLVPITFGDAARLKKGRIVIALGNPYAIARDGQVSASWGIVANLARKAPAVPDESDPTGKSTLHHFGTLIQTDAKLNLGTSGGPLLNLEGQMVGLTTSLAATAGYETAAGYAFPIDDAFRRVVEILKQGREVEYGFLGIQPTNLSLEELAMGLHGTRVRRVVRGTPAKKYGVELEDVITSVNDRAIYDSDGLMLEVGRLPVESVVRLGLLRGNHRLELDVTLTKYPVRGKKIVTTPSADWRGMRIDYPTAVVGSEMGSDLGTWLFDEGVVVTDVEQQSPTWQAGIRPGYLVSRVGRQPVQTPKEFHAAVSGKSGSVQLQFTDKQGETTERAVISGS